MESLIKEVASLSASRDKHAILLGDAKEMIDGLIRVVGRLNDQVSSLDIEIEKLSGDAK